MSKPGLSRLSFIHEVFCREKYDPSKTINAFFAGINNSQSSTRTLVEADNTMFDVSDTSEVGGNVDVVFSRGGTLERAASYFLYDVGFTLSGSATLAFEEGSRFAYGRTAAVTAAIDVSR